MVFVLSGQKHRWQMTHESSHTKLQLQMADYQALLNELLFMK